MVISDEHRFIFLRIPKNASTSLATFFVNNFCNSEDRYTGIGDSKIQTQNIDPKIIDNYRTQYRFIHLTLNEIIQENILKAKELQEKTVISVIRNPLERQLSLFFFKNRRTGSTSPEDFHYQFREGFHETDGSNHILQTEYSKYQGNHYGDYWKYDNLDILLGNFARSKGVDIKEPLQQFKSKYKSKDNKKLIDEYYDKDTRKKVEEYFREDFEVYESI